MSAARADPSREEREVPRVSSSAARIVVRVVESEAELVRLRDAWERLQDHALVASIFTTFDWQSLWWHHYGAGRSLKLLLAETEKGELVGILPIYLQHLTLLRYPVNVLRFVGCGGDTSPDDLGPLIHRDHEAEVARALAKAVRDLGGWDVLLLSDMPPEHVFTKEMTDVARAGRLRLQTGRSERISLLKLPSTWEAWLASVHRDRRYRVRKARKNLLEAYPKARFFVWDDKSTLHAGIDRLAELHCKRWQRVGEPHGFSTPEYLGFHHAVMEACFERDRLRLYCLEIAPGEIIAVYYFYRFRNRVYLMQSGFDPDHADMKPGQVLLGYIIEHAIGEGNEVLDFLRGDHRYKEELATDERETVFLSAFRRRPGAWVYRARRIYLPRLKASLTRALARAVAKRA